MDPRRLRIEQFEMGRLPGLRGFSLYEDTDYPRSDWRRYFWEGDAPAGYNVIARYSKRHPYEKMDIEVIPDVDTHHKHGQYICYLRESEWSANWTAATAILTAFRYLEDYVLGRMN